MGSAKHFLGEWAWTKHCAGPWGKHKDEESLGDLK